MIPYRPALVSVDELREYTARIYPTGSRASAVRALRWAVDSSRSPTEAGTAAMLCLPYRYGGWGTALPQMNRRIDLSQDAQRLLKVPYCSCDLLWFEQHVAIEYYGRTAHSGDKRVAHDWEREIVLLDTGIEVVPVHALQLNDAQRFAAIAKHIKKQLGERYRTDEAKHASATRKMRQELRSYTQARNTLLGAIDRAQNG